VLLRQHDRARYGHADARGERVAEELVVRTPPERIVDAYRAAEGSRFEVETVVLHLVADAIDEHRVRTCETFGGAADLRELGNDARPLVATLEERLGEGLFPADQ